MNFFMNATDSKEECLLKAIEGCRLLIESMLDPHKQPLEREAGFLLAKMLKLQVEALGLLDDPIVQEFLAIEEETRPHRVVYRFPDDFVDH